MDPYLYIVGVPIIGVLIGFIAFGLVMAIIDRDW